METIDARKAERVWQRVQESKPATASDRWADLKELIANEWESAATYQQLSRKLPPKEGQILMRLAREEHAHGAALRGMYALVNGEKCPVHRGTLPQEPIATTLRRCYGLEMRSLKAYEAKSNDPEYGHVFSRIAQQEREHCMALLEVLGALEKE
jgi:rubrerythrin